MITDSSEQIPDNKVLGVSSFKFHDFIQDFSGWNSSEALCLPNYCASLAKLGNALETLAELSNEFGVLQTGQNLRNLAERTIIALAFDG